MQAQEEEDGPGVLVARGRALGPGGGRAEGCPGPPAALLPVLTQAPLSAGSTDLSSLSLAVHRSSGEQRSMALVHLTSGACRWGCSGPGMWQFPGLSADGHPLSSVPSLCDSRGVDGSASGLLVLKKELCLWLTP